MGLVRRRNNEARLKAAAPDRPGGDRFDWWLHTLAEAAFLLLLIVGVELATGDRRIGAFGCHPHPYWLAVLPMAAARGLTAGLTTALVASLLYLVGAAHAIGARGLADFLTLRVMLEPILFFSVSFLVGEFKDASRARIRTLEKDLAEVRADLERIREQRDVLSAAHRILERRLVDQSNQFGTLVATARRTEKADRKEVFQIALELIEEHCGAVSSVLLPLVDGSVHLLCHRGWPEAEVAARLDAARKSAYVRRALREGREVDGFALSETPPESGPLVVSPLFGASGVIEALLCLDEIPTSLLNSSSVRTFKAIGRWASAILARIEREPERARETGAGAHLEPSAEWLGTPEDLGIRLCLEYERATRHGLPLSLLGIQFAGWGGSPPSMRKVDEFVIRHFTTRIRSSDAVYRFPHPGCYVVLLPGTPREGAEVVRERLLGRIRHRPREIGEIRVHVAGPDPNAPDPDSLVLRMVETFREDAGTLLAGERPMEVTTEVRVGSLPEFVRALAGELGLAMRNEYPLQVLGVRGREGPETDPGLLALHVQQVAERALRRVDTPWSVGPSYVAVILPKTEPEQAEAVGERLAAELRKLDPEPAYGEVEVEVMSFGPAYPFYGAFLTALAGRRSLRETAVAGGLS